MTNEQFLKELIINMSKPIPYQYRVQSFSKQKPQATIVAYIDARDCVDLLNQYATYGWHREYFMVGDNTYCRVGVVMPDGSINWRSDCGVESQADKEKGQASDAFKRACVNFGGGRFLYELGMQYVTANEAKTSSNFPYCVDEQGKRIWDLTKYLNDKLKSPNQQFKQPQKTPEAPKQQMPVSKEFSALNTSNTTTPKTNNPPIDTSKIEKAFEKFNYLTQVLPELKSLRDTKDEWKSVTLCADIKTFATEVPKELQLEIHKYITTKQQQTK